MDGATFIVMMSCCNFRDVFFMCLALLRKAITLNNRLYVFSCNCHLYIGVDKFTRVGIVVAWLKKVPL